MKHQKNTKQHTVFATSLEYYLSILWSFAVNHRASRSMVPLPLEAESNALYKLTTYLLTYLHNQALLSVTTAGFFPLDLGFF